MITVGSPSISPDGRFASYVVTNVDSDANKYVNAIWLADLAVAGSAPRQITSGEFADSQPFWSPDGSRLGFVRTTSTSQGRRSELCTMPVNGPGETVIHVSRDEAIQEPSWSADGRWILFASRVNQGAPQGTADRDRPARHITSMANRFDNVGWTADRPMQLFVAAADGRSVARQLTFGSADAHEAVFNSQTTAIAFTSARHENADLDKVIDLWIMPFTPEQTEAHEPERLTNNDAIVRQPSFNEDGTAIAFYQRTGPTRRRSGHAHSQLIVLTLADRSQQVRSSEVDRNLIAGSARRPLWSGTDLFTLAEDHGNNPLLRFASNGAVTRLIDGHRMISGYDIATDGQTVIFVESSISLGTELSVLTSTGERRVTKHQPIPSPLAVERFTVPSEDGCEIDAWLLLPPGKQFDGADGSMPMLLSIHGGPTTQYGNTWSDEFHALTGAGFAVLYCNPHGSSGNTEHYARAIMSPVADTPGTGWGGIDYRDLMAVVDSALDRFPILDRERLGVLGGSYGGFMTSWMVSHTNRFVAACSERGVNNLMTMNGNSDTAGRSWMNQGANPYTHPEEVARMSPITYVQDIQTPLLIIHSDNDLRCPVEQADSMFAALRQLGREVEYWRFPGEGHEMSRSGSPKHRIQRAEIINDWFTRWIGQS